MLDPTVAFDLAQRHFPRSLPPGSSATMVWRSLWTEGLIHPVFLKRGPDGDNRAAKSYFVDGRKRAGIPVHLDSIIGSETHPEAGSKA
jgi:hypothetical protein